MTITTSTLTKAAAVAAMAGGLLFIAVQIKHPLLDAPFTTTTEYAVRETAKIFMAVFSLIGITGIYLRQVQKIGVLGLIGYVLLGVGYLTILSVQVIGVFVLPDLADSQPGYVNDVLAVATSGTPVGDVSRLPDPQQCRHHLHRRRCHLRHRALPGRSPRPVGRRAHVGRRRRDRRHLPAARAHPTAVRHPRRRRPDRPRLLPVARPAHHEDCCLARSAPSSTRPARNDHPARRQPPGRPAGRAVEPAGCRSRWSPSSESQPSSDHCDSSGWPAARS